MLAGHVQLSFPGAAMAAESSPWNPPGTVAAHRLILNRARCYHLPLSLTHLSPSLHLPFRLITTPTPHASLIVRSMSSSSSGNPDPEESVRKAVSENPIVVYSKTWCPYSMEVKSLFKRLGVEPLVIELDQLGGKHVGGCTDTLKLYQNGELTTLLSELNIGSKNL